MVAVVPAATQSAGAPPPAVAGRKARTGYLLLFPGIAWLAVFFAVPFITLFMTSLQQPVPGKSGKYAFGLQFSNYVTSMAEYWPQFVRSFAYAGIATILALIIAYPLAYFIAFRAGKWRSLMLVLVIAPSFASFLLRTYAWKTILADEGVITNWVDSPYDLRRRGLVAAGEITENVVGDEIAHMFDLPNNVTYEVTMLRPVGHMPKQMEGEG